MITKEMIRDLVDELHSNPERDIATGKVDSAWVSLAKLRVDTYLKLIGNNDDDDTIEIDI